jgi:hypothetical protein
MEPHPEREEKTEGGTGTRSGVTAAVVIGAIIVALIVLHLVGAMSLHAR